MLDHLHIEKFALMDKIDINFSRGLNVLTGETGAGKSIIIDATNFVLGGRGSHEFIRTGSDKAFVEALFHLPMNLEVQIKLNDYGLIADIEEDDNVANYEIELILSREISKNGKNYCRINGRTVTLAVYKEIGQFLIDIHGQHDHQSLMNEKKHIIFLDNFGGKTILTIKSELYGYYSELEKLKKELNTLQTNEMDKNRLRDVLDFQIKEIENANLIDNEDIDLNKEKKIISNVEKLSQLTGKSYQLLSEGKNGHDSIYDGISEVLMMLKELENIDSSYVDIKKRLEEAFYVIEDCIYQIRDYKDNINYDPYRLQEINTRLDLINQLKKKYGADIKEIFNFLEDAKDQINKINNKDDIISELKVRMENIRKEYFRIAELLSSERKKIAISLEVAIQKQLMDLNMPKVKFAIDINKTAESKDGVDNVEFLISPNPGEPLKPLTKIASGGELSRVMLAMKTHLARTDEIPTLIFDEVDTGVGGDALQGVAEKLSSLGEEKQVICVTHAPVIAGYALSHFYIEKVLVDGRAETVIRSLNEEERVHELARMLSGKSITDSTLNHAKELLKY